ncbi:hypothetical protein N0V90_012153 [Kalmusia sp. IMI 367209]|nr:hypothetical protein N0V90_012153 [Kalmusia sp. IMI 367209]
MGLNNLSTELLTQIASYLSQVDLLNASLVCKRLRAGTEAELFREYTAVHKRTSFVPFLRVILKRPDLALRVRRIQLREWSTLSSIDWRYWKYEADGRTLCDEIDNEESPVTVDASASSRTLPKDMKRNFARLMQRINEVEAGRGPRPRPIHELEAEWEDDLEENSEDDIDGEYYLRATDYDHFSYHDAYSYSNDDDSDNGLWEHARSRPKIKDEVAEYRLSTQRSLEPDEATYTLYTETAKAAGIISDALPYRGQNELRQKLRSTESCKIARTSWSWDNYLSSIPYDRRFCLGLRAGAEEPLVILLLALLPNVEEIYFQKMPLAYSGLSFKGAGHRFGALKRVAVKSGILELFNEVLQGKNLESFETFGTCSSRFLHEQRKKDATSWLPPKPCNIRRLMLLQGNITAFNAKVLLEACPKLTAFGLIQEAFDPDQNLSLDRLFQLLHPFQEQLEELVLAGLYHMSEEAGIFESLSRMTSLQRLEVGVRIALAMEDDSDQDDDDDDDDDDNDDDDDSECEFLMCTKAPPSLKHLVIQADRPGRLQSDEFDSDGLNNNDSESKSLLAALISEMPPTLSLLTVYLEDQAAVDGFQLALSEEHEPEVRYRVMTRMKYFEEQARHGPNTVFYEDGEDYDGWRLKIEEDEEEEDEEELVEEEEDLYVSYLQATRYEVYLVDGRYRRRVEGVSYDIPEPPGPELLAMLGM